jgi:hypothetical protein
MVNFFYLDTNPKKCAEYYCNKHVLKIPIEIAQILSKIHHELQSGVDYNSIYKNSLVVKNSLGPYIWAIESIDNYLWTCNLGIELINEYKLRYNKESHKTENILKFLLNNPPKLPKIGITKFRGTNKYDMFQYISKDPVECARYNYAEMKCANDKWTRREIPNWFPKLQKSIVKKKKVLCDKINKQVRERLPSLVTKGDRVYRFHSFLRVSYDHLFQGKWTIKAKMMNKYDSKKPLLYQLTYPQLYYVYKIAKSLENKKMLSLLNNESLRYRNKLKFPIKDRNYRANPELYIYKNSVEGMTVVEPYKSEIDKLEKNYVRIYEKFLEYINNNDLIGADMARKFIQVGIKINNKICKEKLELIKNNLKYNEWINNFNWKNTDPYKPDKLIL